MPFKADFPFTPNLHFPPISFTGLSGIYHVHAPVILVQGLYCTWAMDGGIRYPFFRYPFYRSVRNYLKWVALEVRYSFADGFDEFVTRLSYGPPN